MIKGLISPILTPFNDDLSIADDLFTALARELLESGGCAGLVPFGTTGEALSVGVEERVAALDTLIDAGISPARMIPGTGLTSLTDTARLSRHALARGCAGVMTLPPFYYKAPADDDGLFAYYSRLIEMVGMKELKIYLYHIPKVAGVGLSIALVRRLKASFPDCIVGIKDSSGDWNNTKALLEIDGLIVYPGTELLALDAIAMGGPGCISATANINGPAIAAMIDNALAGNTDAARAAFDDVKAVRLLFEEYGAIPAQKSVLAQRTGDKRWNNLRPPFASLGNEKAVALQGALSECKGFAA